MAERTLGVGIVGIGWVANEHIKAFQNNPHSQVVALCSHSRENAEAARQRHELSTARVYTQYEDMLRDEQVDVVAICSMNHLHVPQGIAAAEAGKHALIEKPAANDLDGLRHLERALTRAGVKSLVGFELHWSPFFETIRKLQAEGAFGEIYYAETDYFSGNWEKWYVGYPWVRTKEQGGSALPAAGCHAVDALRQFVPGEAVEVLAYADNFTHMMEWDATIVTLVRFASGAIGKIGCVLEGNTPYTFNVRLHGPKGTLVNNRFYSHLLPGQTGWAEFPTILPDTPQVTHHPFQPEIDHFIDCILHDATPIVDIKDAVKTHEIMFAAELSANERRPVSLPLA